MDNQIITVKATAKKTCENRFAVKCLGVKLAVAFSRDSGAKVGYDAKMLSGEIGSGGSRANWYCYVTEGSEFEFQIDKATFESNKNRLKNWSVEVMPEPSAQAGLLNDSDLE